MNIKIVRLTSGEEIICSCEKNDDSYTLKKPAILIPTGKGTLGLMPWLGYADLSEGKSIDIPDEFVMFTVEPQTELMNEYNSAFGSGLFVPAKSPMSGGGVLPQGSPVDDKIMGKKNPALKLSK